MKCFNELQFANILQTGLCHVNVNGNSVDKDGCDVLRKDVCRRFIGMIFAGSFDRC